MRRPILRLSGVEQCCRRKFGFSAGRCFTVSLELSPAQLLLLAEMVMKVLREYSRLVLVYASFAAFLAAEAAVIFIVYRHMGVI